MKLFSPFGIIYSRALSLGRQMKKSADMIIVCRVCPQKFLGADMKIVIVRSPKFLTPILRKIFKVEKKQSV